MINFYDETMLALLSHDYSIKDIAFIGCGDFYYDTESFFETIKGINYGSNCGFQEINSFTMVMKDGNAFIRWEYDGLEWWHFVDCQQPAEKVDSVEFQDIIIS